MEKKINKRFKKQSEQQTIANKLLGVYPQKQNGLFMQRIKIFAGRINWLQWRKIAQLSHLYSSGFPIHLTTRQDIELHNITAENITAVQQGLASVALYTFGACGDSIRNITVCPCCDFQEDGFDLFSLAQFVRSNLEMEETIFNLPRKFKISFSGCRKACARPFINDLGFVMQENGKFTVIGAGSLGSRPSLGIQLYENLAVKDILVLCIAALQLFEKLGDRDNRRLARFRHIRERLGEKEFKRKLQKQFEEVNDSSAWPVIIVPKGSNDKELLHRFQLPGGNIEPKNALELADVAQKAGATLRLNLEHGLEIYGTESLKLPDKLLEFTKNPTIIACPGSETCPRGLVNCWKHGEKIRQSLTGKLPSDIRINITGCPNNCAHSAISDIGLVGQIRNQDGKRVEFFRLFIEGGNGRNDKLASACDVIAAEDICEKIKGLLKQKL
ncbi:hypothetical protein ACFL1G_06735 [Planctomycetota bacterium]